MTQQTLAKIVTLGALTGVRSTTGLTTLAWQHGGLLKPVLALAAAGEMAADKTTLVGDRIDAVPLAGRALLGGVAGALVARDHGQEVAFGAVLGAVTAVASRVFAMGETDTPAWQPSA